jgi:polyisoprenoid-binding protein YceI
MKRTLVAFAVILMLAASAAAADWEIDRIHSYVGFRVSHMAVSKVKGQFNEFSGTIRNFEGENFQDAAITMEINTKSIDTQNERRDGHLRSGDFFLADSFPTITFVSTSISPAKDGKFQIVGNLTMRGKTNEVTLDAEYHGTVALGEGEEKAGFSATGDIDRHDWGISWSKSLDSGGLVVGNEVELIFELELNKVVEKTTG